MATVTNTSEDRCDACGHEAFVRFVQFPNTPDSSDVGKVLELCGHHANLHESALFVYGWTIAVDNRANVRS